MLNVPNAIIEIEVNEKFGIPQLETATKLLTELANNCPEHFEKSGVEVNFNIYTGEVFLVNDNFDVAKLNGDTLETFYTSPAHGWEGFWEEMIELYPQMCTEDQRWMQLVANGRELPELPELPEAA